MKVILERIELSDQGTFGLVTVDSVDNSRDYFYSGELPDRLNQPGKSCIPLGTYRVVWSHSPALHKDTYRLVDVPKRDGILIHSANLMGDTERGYKAQLQGCIALGEKLGFMDGQRALLLSSPAVRRFNALLAQQPFDLEIR